MSQNKGGRVAQSIRRGFNRQPKFRIFGWDPPADVWSGAAIAWKDLAVTATGGTRDLTVDPANRILWPTGDGDTTNARLKLIVPDLGNFAGTTASVVVRVHRRDRGKIVWREVWEVGETLKRGGANLRVDDISWSDPVYTVTEPKDGVFDKAGDAVKVTVTVARDDYYKAATASGTVKVVADMKALAGNTARDDMRGGKCWNGPETRAGQQVLDDYNNDKDGVKSRATKIMNDIRDKTGPQLTAYMNRLGFDSKQSGRPPNIIWNIAPGVQVRYKPRGDDRRGPCFCIEGKTTDGFSFNQNSAAFKIMPDGTPGPNGVNDTIVPQWVRDAPAAVYQAYMNTACAMTHLECPRR